MVLAVTTNVPALASLSCPPFCISPLSLVPSL
jgi:hypothetical protein